VSVSAGSGVPAGVPDGDAAAAGETLARSVNALNSFRGAFAGQRALPVDQIDLHGEHGGKRGRER